MKNLKLLLTLTLLLVLSTTQVQAAENAIFKKNKAQKQWVDRVMKSMTLDQKIGQMLMPYVYTEANHNTVEEIIPFITQYHVGGVMVAEGTPHKLVETLNRFQSLSKVPLLISIDGEWGAVMRMDSLIAYPWNMTLGAVNDPKLVYEVGQRMGEQCKRLGIHINFAPAVDVNVNSANPIIGNRSFGSDREIVTQRGLAITNGMQSVGVLANVKHFPGHGDTEVDSHKDLPVLPFSRQRLDSLELYPFKKLIDAGVSSVMVSHLGVEALEPSGIPTSISHKVVTDLIRKEMGFKGLVFTDGLEMKGLTKLYTIDQIAVKAVEAGHDMMLDQRNVPVMFEAIKKAVEAGTISEKRLNESVRRILAAKYWAGLHEMKPIATENLLKELNTERDSALYMQVMEKAITLLKNDKKNLPIVDLLAAPIYWVHLGAGESASFGESLRKYAPVVEVDASAMTPDQLTKAVPAGARLIVSYHNTNGNPIKLKPQISLENQERIAALADRGDNTLVLFNMPYGLLNWNGYEAYQGLLLSYQNNPFNHLATAEILFGAIAPEGTLPVTLSKKYPAGFGLSFEPIGRLSYGYPSQVGMSKAKMDSVDLIVREVVQKRAAPAVQVLVARHGKVIYNKNYGSTMYDMEGSIPTQNDMIFDMASVTKIMACLPMVMKLVDQKAILLDDKVGDLVPYLKGSNKENITVRELLTHTGKLTEWIPYYLQTIDKDGKPLEKYYRSQPEGDFNIPITEYMYAHKSTADSLRKQIVESPLKEKKEYVYSDLGFMFLQGIVENYYKRPLDELIQENFYEPLGAYRSGYLPLKRFDRTEIVPSENDTYWRHGIVQGYVHDMTAPYTGSVSGHAGLFSTANDMAKMAQMYLNKGYYGGKQYLSSDLVSQFTACQDCDKGFYRGLGFDRPTLANTVMSQQAFGHTGFTGICVWVDPKYDLVYVFLSNRVFLSMNDNTLSKLNFRGRIQQAIVDAVVE